MAGVPVQGAAKVRTFYSSSFRMPDVPGRSLSLLDTYLGTTRFYGWIKKEHLGTVNILQDRGTRNCLSRVQIQAISKPRIKPSNPSCSSWIILIFLDFKLKYNQIVLSTKQELWC